MLSYRIEGVGAPLLLIHGLGVSFHIWQNLTPILKDHFSLIMIELPGIGESPLSESGRSYYQECANAIDELRQMLRIETWSVLSYSAGTRASEVYIEQYPSHVDRALFLCPAYLNHRRALGLRMVIWLDEHWPELGNWLLSGWRLHELILRLGFNGKTNPYVEDWLEEISAQSINSLKAALYDLPKLGQHPFEFYDIPYLCVWGQQDRVVTRPRRSNPTNHLIPANHGAPLLAASLVADIALSFLGEPTSLDS